jgi:hypothetical protein
MQLATHTCSSCDLHHQRCTGTKDQGIDEMDKWLPHQIESVGMEEENMPSDNHPERSCHRC